MAAFFVLPFLWMFSTSLKGYRQIFTYPPQWIPSPVHWSNYVKAIKAMPFLRYLLNSIFITVVAIVGTVFSSSLVAYSFAKLKWRGRDSLFMFAIVTMVIPLQVTSIPVFVLYKHLGWLNSFKPLTIPYFFGGGVFYIFLLRQFFLTIPETLSDAARMDGCSEFDIYWRIILPLSKPVLATIAIFTFMFTWNDFFGPLIFLPGKEKGTLALGLAMFVGQHGTEWSLLMAASIMLLIPVIIIFVFCQKYFIRGITLTGMKF